MTVGAFVGLAASSQAPGERRVSECREGCLRPLAALSFLEPRAGYRVCDLAVYVVRTFRTVGLAI